MSSQTHCNNERIVQYKILSWNVIYYWKSRQTPTYTFLLFTKDGDKIFFFIFILIIFQIYQPSWTIFNTIIS